MSWRRWGWPVVLIVSTAAVLMAAFLKWPSTIRTIVTLWFMVICPGMALQRVFGIRLQISGWTLAVASSLALDTAVGLALLYSGNWSWKAGLLILSALTLVCTIIEMLIPHERKPQPVIVVTKVPARPRKSKTAAEQEQNS